MDSGKASGKGAGKHGPPPPPPAAVKGRGKAKAHASAPIAVARQPLQDVSSVKLRPTTTRVRLRDGTVLHEKRTSDRDGFESALAGWEASQPQYVLDQEMGLSRLTPRSYNAAEGRWLPAEVCAEEKERRCHDWILERKKLRLVTYNVWFSKERQKERAEALFKILAAADADVICLQEVTPCFLGWLRQEDWARELYMLSDAAGSTLQGSTLSYGVILLIRRELIVTSLNLYTLPSMMHRSVLIVTLLVLGKAVQIATVHLESLNNRKLRKAQLERIFELLNTKEHGIEAGASLLAGDMNFDDGDPEEDIVYRQARFADCWRECGKDEDGFTMPLDDSKLMPTRIDRVFMNSTRTDDERESKAGSLLARSVRRIGMDKINGCVTSASTIGETRMASPMPVQNCPRVSAPRESDEEDTDPDMPELIPLKGGMEHPWSGWKASDYPSDHFGLLCEFELN
eukprot:TRINITY_DN23068_c0_g1_i1.p1 TRINITY_DN23068_c0_g1~~TRINITY_DN23068_c0_g1_i1.p1  ORF type:complete len:457 (+),score=62.72 TRINITY_DN23068_c0_g1_i1:88-1458(+)